MAEKVNMPIECLGEVCPNCPDLDLQVDTEMLTDGLFKAYVNRIYCRNMDRCKGIYSMLKKDWEENHVRKL